MGKVKQAVVLGAGERKCFDRPVGFLGLQDSTIMERLITVLNGNGINDITVVTGYKKEYYEEMAKRKNLNLAYNERYKWTGTMHSLAMAKEYIKDDFILIESDMVFEERAISRLLDNESDTCMVVANESGSGDEAFVEIREEKVFKVSKDVHQLRKIDGEFIGLSKISLHEYNRMLKDYSSDSNPYLNYEYVMLNVAGEAGIGYEKIDELVWGEIDKEEQYENMKHVIYPKLLRKETLVRKQYAREVAAGILNVELEEIKDIEQLGGLSNRNYKITVKGEDLVVRITGNGQFMDRENEKKNSTIAYNLGLDCRALYFNVETGIKICEFIQDAETINPVTAKREHNMELMAGALRTLHASKDMFKINFDPFKDMLYYEGELLKANGKVFDGYPEEKAKFLPLKEELKELGMVMAPCHLDALPENFVKSGEEKIYLIDWEFSGNYDKLWDLASVIVECGFNEDEEELFLSKYFLQPATEAERRRIMIHKISQDMCWCMWAAAKVAKGDDYLDEYGQDRFNRGKALLNKYLEKGVN